MRSQACRQTSIPVDPVALLKREHGMILNQLVMIEMTMNSHSGGIGAAKNMDRATMRELLQFFIGPVEVHFKREEVLVEGLQRIMSGKQKEQGQFQSFLDEPRRLKADAAAVMRKLRRKRIAGQKTAAIEALGSLRTLNVEIHALIRRYREYIASEERLLFVLAELRLTVEQKRRISRRMLQV